MSGGFNPVNIAAQVGLAAMTGGSSLLVQAALRSVLTAVGEQLIQNIGQQLGLPQSMIDTAQASFNMSVGDAVGAQRNLQEAIGGLSDAFGLAGANAGQFQREANSAVDKFIEEQAQQVARTTAEEGEEANGGGGGAAAKAKGGSVLMRIALAIGQALDKKVDRMADIADQLEGMGEVKGENMSQYQALSAEMNALGQELKIVGEALNNTLKSIGETSSALARKQ